MEGILRRRVVVGGFVQGVWFRARCARAAEAAGVAGWVRNRGDGTVEAVFEGPRAPVEAMVAWCREGPPGARIEWIRVDTEAPSGERGFRIAGENAP